MSHTKNEILNVARKIFLTEGLDSLSMRKIATRLEISATAIYRHYRNRDELLLAIVDMSREKFMDYLKKSMTETTSWKRLIMTGKGYLDFGLDNHEEYSIIFMSWNRLDATKHSSEAARKQEHTRSFMFLLERIQEVRSDLEGVQLLDVALHLWSNLHGLVSLYLSGGGKDIFSLNDFREMCYRQLDISMKLLEQEGKPSL